MISKRTIKVCIVFFSSTFEEYGSKSSFSEELFLAARKIYFLLSACCFESIDRLDDKISRKNHQHYGKHWSEHIFSGI